MSYPTGSALAERRRALGLTQRELARQIGVSEASIRNWETRGGRPKTRHKDKLLSALGFLPDDGARDPAERVPGSVWSATLRIGDHLLTLPGIEAADWSGEPINPSEAADALAELTDGLTTLASERGWKVRVRS
jgi:transcriptional regulator with XRE-family HTH domain